MLMLMLMLMLHDSLGEGETDRGRKPGSLEKAGVERTHGASAHRPKRRSAATRR